MAIEGNVKTPLGEVPKKTAVIAGGGAVLLIGVVYYRSKKSAASAAASTPASAADSTLDPSVYDQSTGATWASEGLGPYGQDPNANQTDSSSSNGSQVLGYDSNGNPVYQAGNPSPNTGPGSFTNNAQWAQYAEDYLVNTVGMDASTVGNALGKYISGGKVDDNQFSVIQSAVAFAGGAPVAGTGGFPPNINHVGTPPGNPGGNAKNPVSGLKVTDDGFTSITVEWDKSTGAKSYLVTVFDGSKTVSKKTATGTTARMGSLKRNTHYNIRVRAQPGGTGGTDASIEATTKGATAVTVPPDKKVKR